MADLAPPSGGSPAQPEGPAYEPPSIAWEEEFEPVAQATSCTLGPFDGGGCVIKPQQ